MTGPVLAAGDGFVLVSLLRDALREHLGGAVEIREHELPWPEQPFGDIGEVHEASGGEDDLIEALGDAAVCVTQLAPITERVLEACPRLRFVGVSRGGPVNVNLEAATEHGVLVCNAPGRNATATAEFTIGLMLATLRRICETHQSLSTRHWRGEFFRYPETGIELEHTTVGVLGYGTVGARVAALLAAFGAEVLVYDPYTTVDAAGTTQVADLPELLARAQILTLHMRAGEETERMIDADALAVLPEGAVVINAARGSLLDYEALFDALESGRLAGAGLDVHPTEPVPDDSRLFTSPNVVMTPHVAGASRQVAHNAARIVAEEVSRFAAGEPLAHCQNPEAGGSTPTAR